MCCLDSAGRELVEVARRGHGERVEGREVGEREGDVGDLGAQAEAPAPGLEFPEDRCHCPATHIALLACEAGDRG